MSMRGKTDQGRYSDWSALITPSPHAQHGAGGVNHNDDGHESGINHPAEVFSPVPFC